MSWNESILKKWQVFSTPETCLFLSDISLKCLTLQVRSDHIIRPTANRRVSIESIFRSNILMVHIFHRNCHFSPEWLKVAMPILMTGSEPLLTEFCMQHKLERCRSLNGPFIFMYFLHIFAHIIILHFFISFSCYIPVFFLAHHFFISISSCNFLLPFFAFRKVPHRHFHCAKEVYSIKHLIERLMSLLAKTVS